jgi:hypothetical protein
MIFERGHFISTRIQKSVITDSLRESRVFSSKSARDLKTTVFLSHKHKDLQEEEEARGVIEMLENLGAKVYIDSMDNKMPDNTSGETAARIKEIIKYCNKFILLAQEKAIESYWCNWELGIGDVHKYMDNIAIIPVKEKGEYDSKYKGNEYLQIYPSINYTKAFTNILGQHFIEGYYVDKPEDKNGKIYITELSEWLKKR